MAGLGRLSGVRQAPQFLLFLFVSFSVIYTTNLLFLSPLLGSFVDFLVFQRSVETSRAGIVNDFAASTAIDDFTADFILPEPAYTLLSDNTWMARETSMYSWTSSDFTLKHGLGHAQPIFINDTVVLSKAFSASMRPSNIMPYFYHARGSFDADEITITTLITSNRFNVFERLVEKYRGPISVTVHIRDVPEHVQEVLDALHEMYTSSPLMMTFVDVHLVVDAFDRQFNTWRNIARLYARTDFVMMLDIDFYPCTDFRFVIKRSSTISDKLYAGRAALVVPAFEYVDFHEGTNYAAFPTKKSDLLQLVKQRRIGMFHAVWTPGHNASDYHRFYGSPPGEVYKVTRYQSAYEPYVITRKDGPPWCDERFVGYGGNKAACLFEMYLAGISFYVLSDHFIIHQSHLYEESTREAERKHNRKIYADFREEACLRYLKRFRDNPQLDKSLAENAVNECKKIKSITRTFPKASVNLSLSRS